MKTRTLCPLGAVAAMFLGLSVTVGAEWPQSGPPTPREDEAALVVNPVSVSRSADVLEGAEVGALPQPVVDSAAMCRTCCWAGCGRQSCCWPRLRWGRPCLPIEPGVVIEEPTEAVVPGKEVPGEALAEEPLAPPPTALAGAFGIAPGPQSAAPYMIGDLFGYGSTRFTAIFFPPDLAPIYFSSEIPNPGSGGGSAR